MKGRHLVEVPPYENTPKTTGQIVCQSLDQLLAVTRPMCSLLFHLHNSKIDFPVRGRHDRIHHPGGRSSRGLRK